MTSTGIVDELNSLKAILANRGERAMRLQKPKAASLAAKVKNLPELDEDVALDIISLAEEVLGDHAHVLSDAVDEFIADTAQHAVATATSKKRKTSFTRPSTARKLTTPFSYQSTQWSRGEPFSQTVTRLAVCTHRLRKPFGTQSDF